MSFKQVSRPLGLFNVSPAVGSRSKVGLGIHYLCGDIESCLSKSVWVEDKLPGMGELLAGVIKDKKLDQEMVSLYLDLKEGKHHFLEGFRNGDFITSLF